MVVLGRIVAPFGVQGWLKLHPLADDPASWRGMSAWWLGADPDGKDWRSHPLDGVRVHGSGLVFKLRGVDDRNAAEALSGYFVAAPREALPPTRADEYYWADLIGLDVENAQGVRLGRVAELIETGANDVLVVRDGDGKEMRERLLPFVAQVVRDVDVAGRVIRVDWEADW